MSDGITEARRGTYFSDRSATKQNKFANLEMEARRIRSMAKELILSSDYVLEKIRELKESSEEITPEE